MYVHSVVCENVWGCCLPYFEESVNFVYTVFGICPYCS